MKKTFTAILVFGLACIGLSLGSFSSVFKKTYGVDPSSDLGKLSCATCHEKKSGGKLNPYGVDMQKALKGSKKITPEILKSIEKLDSNKNGKSNLEDIKAGKAPG